MCWVDEASSEYSRRDGGGRLVRANSDYTGRHAVQQTGLKMSNVVAAGEGNMVTTTVGFADVDTREPFWLKYDKEASTPAIDMRVHAISWMSGGQRYPPGVRST